MASGSEKNKIKELLSALGHSPFVLLLLMIMAIDIGCRAIKPLQFISFKSYRPIEFDPWVSKFPPYLYSKSQPDILIVGSSLPMAAFSLADNRFSSQATASDQASLRTYTEAKEFQKELSKRLGENVTVENFSCAGGMVSDTYIFLKRLIEANRVPRMVLYGISPRDFSDNLMPPLGQSPLFEVVSDWGCELPKTGMSASLKFDLICASYSYFYKTRLKYKDIALAFTADSMGRPMSLYKASEHSESKKDEMKQQSSASVKNNKSGNARGEQEDTGTALEKDLRHYAKRYIPVNQRRFENESEYLSKLVRLCEKNRVILIFIGMPLTSENKQLIPSQMKKSYSSAIGGVQGGNRVKWLDLSASPNFEQADFSDSAHLNHNGSKKFQKVLLDELTADPIWQAVKEH